MKAFSVAVDIGGRLNPSLAGAVKGAQSQVAALGRGLSRVNAGVSSTIDAAGRGVAAVGKRTQDTGRSVTASVSAPLGLLGFGAAKAAFEFEKAGNALEALGDASAEQRADLEKYANVLNKKYPQTLTGIIQTGNEMLKGGFNFEQMRGALDQTLATAVIGEMNPAEVGNMMARTINAFQLPMRNFDEAMSSANRVSDQMTYAAVKTTASLRDMGEAYRYVGGAASAGGIPLEKMTALVMAMAKNGSVGSDAGVALRSAIVRFTKTPPKMLATMQRIGMNVNDYRGKGRAVTSGNVIAGLQADGIDAKPVQSQIDKLLKNPKLAGSPVALSAAITKVIQAGVAGAGKGAIDSKTLAQNVQQSVVAAGSQIDLTKFFTDFKKKVEAGQATLGDLATILEGQHFARYQAIMQSDLAKLLSDIVKESPGYTQDRFKTMIKGIVGAVYEVGAAMEGLSVALGRGVFPTAAKGLTALADGVETLSTASPKLTGFAGAVGLALIALGPLMMAGGASLRAIGLLGRGLMLLGSAATLGLATRLVAVAKGIVAVSLAASAGAVGRLRALAAGMIALGAVGGRGAVLAAIGASIASLGRAVLMFPIVALRAIGVAMWGLAANPVGIALTAIVAGLAALGLWVKNNWTGIKTFFSSFGEAFTKALGPGAAGAMTAVVSGLTSVWDAVNKILGPIDEVDTKWKTWGESAGQAAAAVVNAITALPGQVAAIGGQFAAAMTALAQQGWAAFKAIDWASLGSALIDGIVSGVTSAAGRLASAVGDAASVAWVKAKSIFGGGGGAAKAAAPTGPKLAGERALGGPVRSGAPYLVGERGPEIFVPSSAGRIETNGSYRRLAAAGSTSGGGPRAPSADDIGAAGGSGGTTNVTHVKRGDLTVTMQVQAGGNGSADLNREIERAVRRVLEKYESEQRGMLSD
ncbi:phage tail tape measure protein [Methylobacterium sp. NEAU 140]|uniref:phage tail tape measure protein n=1 Tax=Methylobacterium sp. NEAU 140 TaxID=3064945 RepID=UPI002735AAD0|nr:phage tail tape measure protein [Methylobacterium sp. NEAU 140]MDP4022056.1 phage tail tape measure protein [Methylobacterium sp. NEAU 140]